MFSSDCDFDIDEEFLKDVFKSVEDHAVLKRSSPPPQKNINKKLRIGSSEPPPTLVQVSNVVVARPPPPSETPTSSLKKRRPSECASRPRKFPGPAGLLPDRGSSSNRTLEAQSDSEGDAEIPAQELCSQPSRRVFESEAWLQARRDLGPAATSLTACTLRWARCKALAGQLPNLRVPFLLVALHTIDCSLQDPFVLLHDLTGQMPGTLHREVREAHEARLRPGTVLMLWQVGVLTTRRTLRNHYLNITANNLVGIYHAPDQLRPDVVEVERLRDVSLLDAVQSIRDAQERRLVADLPAAHVLDRGDGQLFTTVGSPSAARGTGVHPLKVPPRLQTDLSGNRLNALNSGLTCAQGRESNRTPLSVSKLPSAHSSSTRPRLVPLHNGIAQVPSKFPGCPATSAVAPSQNAANCGISGTQCRLLGKVQANQTSRCDGPLPNKAAPARGFGFKPKTPQLNNLGTSCIANGWDSGVSAGDFNLSADGRGRVGGTPHSSKAVDVDDERRIVENVLESFDASQLFDEDF